MDPRSAAARHYTSMDSLDPTPMTPDSSTPPLSPAPATPGPLTAGGPPTTPGGSASTTGATGMPAYEDKALVETLRSDLHRLIQSQASLVKNPTQESYAAVAQSHNSLRERAAGLIREFSLLWMTAVLPCPEIERVRDCVQDLNIIQRHLEVLQTELQAVSVAGAAQSQSTEGSGANTAALMVKRQPFPLVLRKGEQLTEADCVVVRLVSPSASALTVASQVHVHVLCDGQQVTRSTATHELVEPISAPLDPATLTAKFPLKFIDGTKNTSVTLKFSVRVSVAGAAPSFLESDPTPPLIVTTHKDQWRGAAGSMLRREAFMSLFEVPWEQLANTLQLHFIRATKQSLGAPRRPLSPFDLAYIRKRFFTTDSSSVPAVSTPGGPAQLQGLPKSAGVQQTSFDNFWAWFGEALNTLRHQRPVLSLWWQGLVYGFASKEDVDIALGNQTPGTFIVRFSESSPGSFAIAYNTYEGVKHYLVTPQDHALHRTLPDFIVSQAIFGDVLQLQAGKDSPSSLQLVRVNKVAAFEPFCTKKLHQAHPVAEGYSRIPPGGGMCD